MGVEELFETAQVIGVEVVDVGGEKFAPERLACRTRKIGVAQNRTFCRRACAAAMMPRSFSRSAAGNGPSPSQLKLSVQLSLISGTKEAGAALPRSASRPS